MNERTFGRTGWSVSEIGYGMWGMGAWTGSNDDESMASLERAVELGCNFFDTAWAYGQGHSERLLGRLLRSRPGARLHSASKIPPRNLKWPATAEMSLDDTFPPDHIRAFAEKSLENIGVGTLDLLQFHTWHDAWADDERWQRAVASLKGEGLVRAVGISVNRWQPENGLRALRTGLIDAVQVVYNIFDQSAEDELFPACQRLGVAVIARVPFDEGSLTGALTMESQWPEGDFRNIYFSKESLAATLPRVEKLKQFAADHGMTLSDLALRFILSHPAVTTTIPGMRREQHVAANLQAGSADPLAADLIAALRAFRWDRRPDHRP